ncbi:hypothetical protein GPU96_07g13130 [Encephalitozoon hellem]|uniref:Uncharacterized protein n=2 Tax=Encephalitozoon hellem TaxID=27973 RepID=A0A9Q9F8K8_ENCHE|nr:hypothetical protein GPU96_07g13130 [Encephalitozoon hellem]
MEKNKSDGEKADMSSGFPEVLLPIEFYDKCRRPRDDQKIEFVSWREKDSLLGAGKGDFVGIVNALENENLKMEKEIMRLAEKQDRICKENEVLRDVLYGLLSKSSS